MYGELTHETEYGTISIQEILFLKLLAACYGYYGRIDGGTITKFWNNNKCLLTLGSKVLEEECSPVIATIDAFLQKYPETVNFAMKVVNGEFNIDDEEEEDPVGDNDKVGWEVGNPEDEEGETI